MSNIDKRATDLLIENGVLVADTLRHLADNEIDSDYFAICHTNENGTEIECELAITDYARQAAGTVDELVKALKPQRSGLLSTTLNVMSNICWVCVQDGILGRWKMLMVSMQLTPHVASLSSGTAAVGEVMDKSTTELNVSDENLFMTY
jgi:hypothetical protein